MSGRNVFRAVIVILAVSATAGVLVPKAPFLGLDFQNMDAFHDCVARNNPYLGTGELCGDVMERNSRYPPLLYWSFVWTRAFSFEVAYTLWAAFTLVASTIALAMWVPIVRRDGPTLLFAGLLLLQFPMLFQLERGNNDAIVLILWSVSAWLLMRGRPGWAGLVAGLSVLLKLYPAFAVLVVVAGLLAGSRSGRFMDRRVVRYGAGGLAAMVLFGLPLVPQTIDWVTLQLPSLMAERSPLTVATHSLSVIAPGGQSWVLSLPILAVWSWASYRRLADDPVLVLSGALAISTYFASMSVDYNLITTYPFLLVLFIRATSQATNATTVGVLLLGLVAIIGHRSLFLAGGDIGPLVHLWLQWIWLMAAGAAAASSRISTNEDPARDLRLLPAPRQTMANETA